MSKPTRPNHYAPALHLPVRFSAPVTTATIRRAHEAGIDLAEPGEGHAAAADRINAAQARLDALVAAEPIPAQHMERVTVVLDKGTAREPFRKAVHALYPRAGLSWVTRAESSDVCGSAIRCEVKAGYFPTSAQHMATSRAVLGLVDA